MDIELKDAIFITTILMFFFSAIIAILKPKLERFSVYISILLTAFVGIMSLAKLIFYSNNTLEFSYKSSIGFMNFNFKIDNLSSVFLLLISVISMIIMIYSLDFIRRIKLSYNSSYLIFLMNLLILFMLLVVISTNFFAFIVIWELMSVVSYFLVIFKNNDEKSIKAGTKYLIMTHIGTFFLITAFAILYSKTGVSDFSEISINGISSYEKLIVGSFLLAGFGVKLGIVPLHVWMPDAYEVAPSNASAMLSAVMKKVGVYGLIRFIIVVLGMDNKVFGSIVIIFGATSIFLGIIFSLAEINIKRFLAYSSIENSGIIVLGIGLSILANSMDNHLLAAFSLTAAIYHTFNHSVFKSLLFLGAGSIESATGSNNMENLGGLVKRMPTTSLLFLIGCMGASALPPLNGFVSEWLLYQATFYSVLNNSSFIKLILIITVTMFSMGGALAVYSYVRTFGISFLAMPRGASAKEAKEVGGKMLLAKVLLSILVVILGLFPRLMMNILDKINSDVFNVTVSEHSSFFTEALSLKLSHYNASVSPIFILFAVLIILIVYLMVNKIFLPNIKIRKYGTWDCGYLKLNPKMQYTATGFSKPIWIVLKGILKPQRDFKMSEPSKYFFRTAHYVVTTQSFVDTYLYDPLIKSIVKFSRRVRFTIQTGSIMNYLTYIFVALIILMIYSVWA